MSGAHIWKGTRANLNPMPVIIRPIPAIRIVMEAGSWWAAVVARPWKERVPVRV